MPRFKLQCWSLVFHSIDGRQAGPPIHQGTRTGPGDQATEPAKSASNGRNAVKPCRQSNGRTCGTGPPAEPDQRQNRQSPPLMEETPSRCLPTIGPGAPELCRLQKQDRKQTGCLLFGIAVGIASEEPVPRSRAVPIPGRKATRPGRLCPGTQGRQGHRTQGLQGRQGIRCAQGRKAGCAGRAKLDHRHVVP